MIKKTKSIHNPIFPGQCHDESWIFHFYVGLIEKNRYTLWLFLSLTGTHRRARQTRGGQKIFASGIGCWVMMKHNSTIWRWWNFKHGLEFFFKQVNMVKVPLQGHFVIFQQLSCSKSYMSCLFKMFICCLVVLRFLHVFFWGIGFIYLGHQVSCCLRFPL